MNRFVVDASVALGWCFENEASARGDEALAAAQAARVLVPALFPLEVANVLAGAERRGRLRPAQSARFLELLEALPLEVDAQTAARAWRETLALARAHRLTAYDAAYLELALRHGVALYTRDAELAVAAEGLGLETPMQH